MIQQHPCAHKDRLTNVCMKLFVAIAISFEMHLISYFTVLYLTFKPTIC